ncbi:MAG: peptidoglycan-associated lipoprotein Pal [Verrucomicrobiota bacterium]|nr:peptidoglycan-associated lipoprotein Pal [Verrucomicrobiota bacterium]
MKLICLPALALALSLAATGCKHKPVGVTPLPGEGQVGEQNPNTLGGGNQLPPTTPPVATPMTQTGIPESATWNLADMTQDRQALAAYTIHFAFDSAAIRSSEQANLQSVASALSSDASAKLLIEGNCDERGTEEYNRALGERRALAAREALAQMGVDPNRIRTISYGKDKPADPGHDESAWAKNRRDDFVLLHPKTGA